MNDTLHQVVTELVRQIDDAEQIAYEKGKDEGYDEGHDAGQEEGFADGFDDGVRSVKAT